VENVKRIVPILPVRDLRASLAHYGRLGFATREYAGGGYGYASLDGIEIHLGVVSDVDPRTPRSVAYLFVEDADQLAQTWRAAGADVRVPEDTEWGQHEGVLIDPDGNMIRFGSPMTSAHHGVS
jgi:catechol 2,3-dioxygenase-like lactoylglutathione lyase family enzyme